MNFVKLQHTYVNLDHVKEIDAYIVKGKSYKWDDDDVSSEHINYSFSVKVDYDDITAYFDTKEQCLDKYREVAIKCGISEYEASTVEIRNEFGD